MKLSFNNSRSAKQKFVIPRTAEGTIFEAVFIVLAIISWAVIVVQLRHGPDTVVTHFDITGTPDGYGSKLSLLFPCIMTTVVGLCMLAGAYFPHTVNLPVQITNMRQALMVTRMMRILSILFLLLTLSIALGALHQPATALPTVLCVALMIVVIAVFTSLTYKAKES